MNIPVGRRILYGLLSGAASLSICLGAVELLVRLGWDNQPDGLYPSDTGCCANGGLRPGVVGHDRFHAFRHNDRGYRGADTRAGKVEHPRVAVVGDSFVYGVGARDDRTIPARLEAELNRPSSTRIEVINGGVPGADLESSLDRVDRVVGDYRPDVVILMLLYNDLDLGTGPGSQAAAPLRASPVAESAELDWRGRLGHQILPVIDPRLGNAANPSPSVVRRYALARSWRTLMYAGLELQRVGTHHETEARTVGLMHLEQERIEELAWRRARQGLARLAARAQRERFQAGVVLFDYGPLEGIPALRIREVLAESGLPWLDLAPAWGSYEQYVREYSFRFDLHPNHRANTIAAEGIAALVGPLVGRSDPGHAEWLARHDTKTKAWLVRQEALAAEQREQIETLRAGFVDRIGAELTAGVEPTRAADQWLYGWWFGISPAGAGEALLGTNGDFVLRTTEAGATGLTVQGRRLHSDRALGLSLDCGQGSIGPFVPTEDRFEHTFPFPSPLPPHTLADCRLQVGGEVPAPAARPGAPSSPPASFVIRSLALTAR